MAVYFPLLIILFGILLSFPLHRLTPRYSGIVLSFFPLLCFIWFLQRHFDLNQGAVFKEEYSWFTSLGVSFDLYLDGLSILMGILITGIGSVIVVYASGYLSDHHHLARFYVYLFLFMGAMLGVVMSDNLILLFVFWELTSISSYLLIGFYHESSESRRNSLQALLTTGIGGAAMLAGFVLLGLTTGTFSLSELLSGSTAIHEHRLYIPITILILLGAFTKSAQFPFHFWLPNAMAGPAPVSSFLHSATMVKAGIFLMARLTPILGGTLLWTETLTIVGLVTMLIGAFGGLCQIDLKKILAYTTLSVLGMLTMLLGLGTDLAIKSAIVFLLGHALYKATLFMTAGILDHETGTRNVRLLRGLRPLLPYTAFAGGLAALSKSGFPPFFGFLGKEYVYKAGVSLETLTPFILGAAMITNMILMALAFKVGVHPYWGKQEQTLPKKPHEAPLSMLIGPLVLSLVGLLIGLFPGFLVTPLVLHAVQSVAGHDISFTLSLWHGINLPLLLSVLTLGGGIFIYKTRHSMWDRCESRADSQGLFDRFYETIFQGFIRLSKKHTAFIQSGYLRNYVFVIVSFTAVVLTMYSFDSSLFPSLSFAGIGPLGFIVALLITVGTIISLLSHSRLTAILAVGVVGLGVALVFVLFSSPDLAITQILVETLLVILLMMIMYQLPAMKHVSTRRTLHIDSIVATTIGILVTFLVLKAQEVQIAAPISEKYGELSYLVAKGKNVVNVILVDFRALDTLGEITVLTIAALGFYLLLRIEKGRYGHK